MSEPDRLIVVGKVAGAFGVQGWLKIYSYTDPFDNILDYAPWVLAGAGESKEYPLLVGRVQGNSIIALLEGIDDRDKALSLKSRQVYVPRDRLPELEAGQYYWSDLIGLGVSNLEGVDFGTVTEILATGANDVVVVKGEQERLIPFVRGDVIKDINLSQRSMVVDWDAEF